MRNRANSRRGHHDSASWRGGDHRGVAYELANDAHLPEEVTRAEASDSLAVARHLSGAILQYEKLAGEVALAHELCALRDVELVRVLGYGA